MAIRKQKTELIAGIDIGSNNIRIAVGQMVPQKDLGEEVQVIATAQVASSGVHKGAITSIEEAVSSTSHVLEEVEKLIGIPIERAWVGVSGTQIMFQESRGAVAVAKQNGEISREDVIRVIDAARTITSPLNYEVLHVLPKNYSVDGQTGIKDPIGMTGVRLETNAQIIYGATPYVNNVMKAVHRTGVEIEDLVLSILATSEVVLSPKQKDLGVVLVDIGGSTTTIAVYEEGNIIHISVVPIGADHITNDIALGLQTDVDVAERVKLAYGQCDLKAYTKKDIIHLDDFGGSQEAVSLKFITEIIHARVVEILEKVNEELTSIDRKALLPAGMVFTGGGAKLHGLAEVAKSVIGMNATYGFPTGMQSATGEINDLSFTTAFGLVKWGASIFTESSKGGGIKFGQNGQIGDQLRKIFKFLVP